MCRKVSSRVCGVCVKLRSLLKVHYTQFHSNYDVCISITCKARSKSRVLQYESDAVPGDVDQQSSALQVSLYPTPESYQTHSYPTQESYQTQTPLDIDTIKTECDQINEDEPKNTRPDDTNTNGYTPTLPDDIFHHSTIEQYSCFCGKSFRTTKELTFHDRVHKIRENPKIRPHGCNICDRRFKYLEHLRNHKQIHEIYDCVCGASFDNEHAFDVHKKWHDKVPDLPVSVVSKKNKIANTEKPGVNANKPHQCKLCSKRFRKKYYLTAHEFIHSDVRPHGCELCDKTFPNLSMLYRHSKTHSQYKRAQNNSRRTVKKVEKIKLEAQKSRQTVQIEEERFYCDCGKHFKTVKERRAHEKVHKTPQDATKRPHGCGICDVRFKTTTHLRDHLRTHSVFECLCKQSFNNRQDLDTHKSTDCSRGIEIPKDPNYRPHACDVCGFQFKATTHLRDHKRTHGIYECLQKCAVSFKSQEELDAHKLTHEVAPVDDKPHVCKVCSKSYKTANSLREHEFLHAEDKPYSCRVCEKRFAKAAMLRKHEKQSHPGGEVMVIRTADNPRPHVCHVCNKAFKQKGHLIDHRYMHMEKSHLCEDCGDKFNSPKRLKRHRLVHHEERGYRCDICGKGFINQTYLREHARTHTGERPYRCEYCGVAFNNRSNLSAHIRIHTGEKPFKCDQCEYRAAQRNSLAYHKLIHDDVRNFQCTICLKRFRHRTNLREHINRHRGIKRHVCSICSKAFVTKTELKEHSVAHSDKRPFKCKFCSAAFKRSDHVLPHMRSHHKDRLNPDQLKRKPREQPQSLPSKTAKLEQPWHPEFTQPPPPSNLPTMQVLAQPPPPSNLPTMQVLAHTQQQLLEERAHALFAAHPQQYEAMQAPSMHGDVTSAPGDVTSAPGALNIYPAFMNG